MPQFETKVVQASIAFRYTLMLEGSGGDEVPAVRVSGLGHTTERVPVRQSTSVNTKVQRGHITPADITIEDAQIKASGEFYDWMRSGLDKRPEKKALIIKVYPRDSSNLMEPDVEPEHILKASQAYVADYSIASFNADTDEITLRNIRVRHQGILQIR